MILTGVAYLTKESSFLFDKLLVRQQLSVCSRQIVSFNQLENVIEFIFVRLQFVSSRTNISFREIETMK